MKLLLILTNFNLKETDMTQNGTLIVKTLAADEAIPIPDSVVRIEGEGNSTVKRTLFTDEDGITEIVSLPAPDRSLSLSPEGDAVPYSTYTVTVISDGYYTKVIKGVAVFPDTLSLLSVVMIPYVSYNDGGRYPRDNLVSDT